MTDPASIPTGGTTSTSGADAPKATPAAPASPAPARRVGGGGGGAISAHASLSTEYGQTRIADGVVAKIAGMAAQEIPGVYAMGRGLARRMGQLRALVPGSSDQPAVTQGVSVEVGERESAVDLDLVTWYGQSIVEVTEAVRRNVIDRVEGMTGLKVVEVNINVDDIYVEGEQEEPAQTRVQ